MVWISNYDGLKLWDLTHPDGGIISDEVRVWLNNCIAMFWGILLLIHNLNSLLVLVICILKESPGSPAGMLFSFIDLRYFVFISTGRHKFPSFWYLQIIKIYKYLRLFQTKSTCDNRVMNNISFIFTVSRDCWHDRYKRWQLCFRFPPFTYH